MQTDVLKRNNVQVSGTGRFASHRSWRCVNDGNTKTRYSAKQAAATKLASVFEPFVQVDVNETRRKADSGLGLAISRDLARGMGGDLLAQSEEGRGFTFTLLLPRVASP
jgi:hypothetical protein